MTTKLGQWRLDAIRRLRTAGCGDAVEINAILQQVLEEDLAWIITNPGFCLTVNQIEEMENCVQRLKLEEPLAYILGHREFFGLNFIVSPAVLIPRPETELLVQEAIHWGLRRDVPLRILDVGTGSGCIALSVLHNLPQASAAAADISLAALRVAWVNAERLLIKRIAFLNTDLTMGIRVKFDLVCANLPYIPTLAVSALPHARYEPRLALDGGTDGQNQIRRLLRQLPEKINQPGLILLEVQFDQGKEIGAFAQAIFPRADISILQDHAGLDRLLRIEI